MTAARSGIPVGAFENWMLDRGGLLSSRLALAGPQRDLATADAVNDLRVGLNVAELQRVRRALDGPAAPAWRGSWGRWGSISTACARRGFTAGLAPAAVRSGAVCIGAERADGPDRRVALDL